MKRSLAALGLALVGSILFACASATSGARDLAAGERAMTLVFLKSGPNSGKLAPEENQRAFAGHFSNMGRLADERKLLVAGPFGKTRHDDSLRGLFVLDSAKLDEAREWAASDPTTQAGVFVLEFHELVCAADFRGALERALERGAAAKREGRTPSPAEGARPYVLLTCTRDAKSNAALAEAGAAVLFAARMDGERCLWLLDAKDVADAKARFEGWLSKLGEHQLDDWFASDELARMRAR